MTNGNFRLSEASHFFGESKWGNNKETNYTLLFTFLAPYSSITCESCFLSFVFRCSNLNSLDSFNSLLWCNAVDHAGGGVFLVSNSHFKCATLIFILFI